jgi:hypothetical protein
MENPLHSNSVGKYQQYDNWAPLNKEISSCSVLAYLQPALAYVGLLVCLVTVLIVITASWWNGGERKTDLVAAFLGLGVILLLWILLKLRKLKLTWRNWKLMTLNISWSQPDGLKSVHDDLRTAINRDISNFSAEVAANVERGALGIKTALRNKNNGNLYRAVNSGEYEGSMSTLVDPDDTKHDDDTGYMDTSQTTRPAPFSPLHERDVTDYSYSNVPRSESSDGASEHPKSPILDKTKQDEKNLSPIVINLLLNFTPYCFILSSRIIELSSNSFFAIMTLDTTTGFYFSIHLFRIIDCEHISSNSFISGFHMFRAYMKKSR